MKSFSLKVKTGPERSKTPPVWVHVLLSRGAWKGLDKHISFPKLLIAKKLICLSVQVRQENPNFAVGQIGKELGRRWAEADPEVGC